MGTSCKGSDLEASIPTNVDRDEMSSLNCLDDLSFWRRRDILAWRTGWSSWMTVMAGGRGEIARGAGEESEMGRGSDEGGVCESR